MKDCVSGIQDASPLQHRKSGSHIFIFFRMSYVAPQFVPRHGSIVWRSKTPVTVWQVHPCSRFHLKPRMHAPCIGTCPDGARSLQHGPTFVSCCPKFFPATWTPFRPWQTVLSDRGGSLRQHETIGLVDIRLIAWSAWIHDTMSGDLTLRPLWTTN